MKKSRNLLLFIGFILFIILFQLLIYPLLKKYEILNFTEYSVFLIDVFASLLIGTFVFFVLKKSKDTAQYSFYSSIIFVFVSFFILNFSRLIWKKMSIFTSKILKFLLSNIYSVSLLSSDPFKPMLTVKSWNIVIGATCSGIESLCIFLSLFIILPFIYKSKINLPNYFFLMIAGLVGIFLVNILRLFIITIIGVEISTELATKFFHSNLAWLMFVSYFAAFWLLFRNKVLLNVKNKVC